MAAGSNSPRIALVLGGGGSRGAVGVGLYKALVELGIPLDFIVSSSIGAVTGAFIAAGMSPTELESHWKSLRTSDVIGSRWQFLRLLMGASSAFTNGSLRNLLRRVLPIRSFSELRIPLAIVTTDLETGETIVLTEGDLIDAILASTALPGLFPPIARRGRRLVDGGLSNNVPIDLAIERGADRVIGMLCGCTRGLPARPNFVTVLGQSFSLALNARYRCDAQMYKPQARLHILEPCFDPTLDLLDFDHAAALIQPAYEYALEHLGRQMSGELRSSSLPPATERTT
jgi:NTE family protein